MVHYMSVYNIFGEHGYPPNSIFSRIYFTAIHVIELLIALILIIQNTYFPNFYFIKILWDHQVRLLGTNFVSVYYLT